MSSKREHWRASSATFDLKGALVLHYLPQGDWRGQLARKLRYGEGHRFCQSIALRDLSRRAIILAVAKRIPE